MRRQGSLQGERTGKKPGVFLLRPCCLPEVMRFSSSRSVARSILFLLIVLVPAQGHALEAVTLKIERLQMREWQLQGIEVALDALGQPRQQLGLSIKRLNLPKPLDDLQLFDIRCRKFVWSGNEINCQKGKASIRSRRFSSPRLEFSFVIGEKRSRLNISRLKLLNGTFNLQAEMTGKQWAAKLDGKKIGLKTLQKLFAPKLKLSSGHFNLKIETNGDGAGISHINARANIAKLSLQTEDGTKACENLSLKSSIRADRYRKYWYWQQHSVFGQGMLYIEPFYMENENTPISLDSSGAFYPKNRQVEVDEARFKHPGIGTLDAYGELALKPFTLTNAKLHARIDSLQQGSEIYLNPILETGDWEGLSLKGSMDAGLSLENDTPARAYLIADKLEVQDPKKRLDLKDGGLALDWSQDEKFTGTSSISWQQFDVYSIPLPRSYLSLLLRDKHISLLKGIDVPLLGGSMQIKKFDWQAGKENGPKVAFSGKMDNISLEQLTTTLGMRELSGNLSGDIPGVHFEDGKLTLEGGLKIKLFDGEININKLAMSGVMSDFPQFYSDIEIDNLDLDLLTQKFEFGGMKGRLSGYVNNLYMENWQPVQFYAWLGTPEDDDSPHQISQKAVENLASIGGGGAVDLISRTFLGLFDNFDYDAIGLGCYLNNGVCQLMGVEAAGERGYYIVKGGGLPRIDVMGYNTRIDWEVLWERLSRVTQTTDVVVE